MGNSSSRLQCVPVFNRNINPKAFNLDDYLGIWWEAARSKNWYETGCKRSRAEYRPRNDGSAAVSVTNYCYLDNGRTTFIKGTAWLTNPLDQPYAFHVAFENMPDLYPAREPNYEVVITDYNTYAVVQGVGDLWVLTRSQSISQEYYNCILYQAKQAGIDISKLTIIGDGAINHNI